MRCHLGRKPSLLSRRPCMRCTYKSSFGFVIGIRLSEDVVTRITQHRPPCSSAVKQNGSDVDALGIYVPAVSFDSGSRVACENYEGKVDALAIAFVTSIAGPANVGSDTRCVASGGDAALPVLLGCDAANGVESLVNLTHAAEEDGIAHLMDPGLHRLRI